MTMEKRSVSSPAETAVLSLNDDAEYGTLSVFELRKLPGSWPDILNKAPIRFRAVTEAEAARLQLAQEKSGHYPPGDVARRLSARREAFVGEVETPAGNLIVTYGWVALSAEPMGNTGYSFNPPPGEAYLYDFATVPEYRGQGFYPALLRFILGELARRGIRRAWIGTAPGNHASAHSIQRAGFNKIADVNYVPAEVGKTGLF